MTNAPTPPRPDEAVARLIDPEAFEADPEIFAMARWGAATEGRVSVAKVLLAERRAKALETARAILALPFLASRAEEIAALREALEPFAEAYDAAALAYPNPHNYDSWLSMMRHSPNSDDFRRASRALTPWEGGNG